MPRTALMFLSYGGSPSHVAETTYAVLSAARAARGDRDLEIVLYTDRPETYAGMPARIRPITAGELEQWAGPHGYAHRRKMAALDDALSTLGVPVALVDSDTWFRKPPSRLFERVAPGRSVLHLREGTLAQGRAPDRRFAAEVADRTWTQLDGRPLVLGPGTVMWNSGVVGLHPSDGHLVREAMHLTDQVYAEHRDLFTLEQLALSCFLDARTTVSPSSDVVYHYWHDIVRAPFQERLPALLEQTAALPERERMDALHRARPRLHGRDLARFLAREVARSTGRRTHSVRSNAT